ncbi:MAG: sigma-70 family RNA polymerase sigma factor [Melioribacteraceae bacterium]|nr:sigma-70 family RNA polymerase sigma factor [Melioribacteraceae bacterium]
MYHSSLIKDNIKYRNFENEVSPHLKAIYNFAFKITKNMDDSQDLVQETLLRAYRFFDSFEIGTNCKSWLFSILHNTFINNIRKKNREPQIIELEKVEHYLEEKPVAESVYKLDNKKISAIFDDDISTAIISLPHRFKEIIVLRDIEGFTYEEISEKINIPLGTVRSRLNRARNLLQNKLFDYAKNNGYLKAS